MPLRDYRCPQCGHTEEHLVKRGEELRKMCPNLCLIFDPNVAETGYAYLEPVAFGDTSHFKLKSGGVGWSYERYSGVLTNTRGVKK